MTTPILLRDLTEGDIVVAVGATEFDAPMLVTEVRAFNGRPFAIVVRQMTASGLTSFWPLHGPHDGRLCEVGGGF